VISGCSVVQKGSLKKSAVVRQGIAEIFTLICIKNYLMRKEERGV
jgi:hypothetical protein